MKKFMTIAFLASAALSAHAQTANTAASGPQLMGFETVKVADQEVRVATTREERGGKVLFCHQYVKSYKREMATMPIPGMMGEDTTSIVLCTNCTSQ